MNIGPKKALAIHDLSGVGRCALSVIFPTLSAMGVQVCAVPTAILSAHTAFSDVAFYDLTEYMKEALSHYKNLDIDAAKRECLQYLRVLEERDSDFKYPCEG